MRALLLATTAVCWMGAAQAGSLTGGSLPAAVLTAAQSAAISGAVQAAGGDTSATTSIATGSTTARTTASRDADVINVRDFGAVPNFQYIYQQAYIAAGSTNLFVWANRLTGVSVGDYVIVPGAGAGGAALVATVTAKPDTLDLTLSTAASTTVGTAANSSSTPIVIETGTDDTAAINAALAAARLAQVTTGSRAYSHAHVVMPSSPSGGEYLAMGSINATMFTAPGLVVDMRGASIHSAAAGKVAVDIAGTNHSDWLGLDIFGDLNVSPAIGFQIGRVGTTGSNSSDVNQFDHPVLQGNFTLTGILNEQSETSEFHNPRVANGAPAAYAAMFDGVNHVCMTSDFIPTASFTQGCGTGSTARNGGETSQAFGDNKVDVGVFGTTGAGSIPLFIAGTSRLTFDDAYLANTDTSAAVKYHVQLYFWASGAVIQQLNLDAHSETAANVTSNSIIEATGPAGVTSGQVEGLHYRDNGAWAATSIFAIDPSSAMTSLFLPNVDIDLGAVTGASATLLDTPSRYTLSGKAYLPSTLSMAGANWTGILCQSTACDASTLTTTPTGGTATPLSTVAANAATALARTSSIGNDGTIASVSITPGNGFWVQIASINSGAAFTLKPVFGAPPTGGTQAVGHYVFGTNTAAAGDLASGGQASDGYTQGQTYQLFAADGTALPFVTDPVNASGGVITSLTGGFHPLSGTFLVSGVIPALPYYIGSGHATITQLNFQPTSVVMDNKGAGYVTMPSVTASTGAASNLAGTAWSFTANPGVSITFSTGVFGSLQAGGGPVSTENAVYQIKQSDCGSLITDYGTSNHTYTVPTGLSLGCQVDVEQQGTGTVTFAGASGETLEQQGSGTLTHTTIGQFAKATLKIDSGSSFLLGGGVQ